MEQADILCFAVGILENLNIPYMLVGSMASSAYGEARLTQDIDNSSRGANACYSCRTARASRRGRTM